MIPGPTNLAFLIATLWCARSFAMPCTTVVDQHGKPIAGVEVYARHDPSMTDLGATDAKGKICLPSDESSPLELWAPEAIGGWCAGRVELEHDARPARITMNLTVFPLTTLHGRVVDSAGTPIAGATIELHGISFDGCTISAGASVKSSRAGTFALQGMRGDYEVLVKADGFATTDTVLNAKDKTHDVVLDQGASWRGHVVAPDGSVVKNATVSFGRINRDRVTIEVSSGAFDAQRLTPGDYTMKIDCVDHPVLGTRTEWRDIKIKPGDHRSDDIAFSGGIELAGVAMKDPGACIVAAPAKYDRDGIFDMRIRVKPTADRHFAMHQVPRGDWVLSNCAEYPKVVVDAGRLDVEVP